MKKLSALLIAVALAVLESVAFARAPDNVSITGYRRPLGYQQLTNAVLQASVGLTIPTLPAGSPGPGFLVIQCQAGAVRWRDDGSAPTSTVGMLIQSGGELTYVGEVRAIRFITSSGTPICDASIYE